VRSRAALALGVDLLDLRRNVKLARIGQVFGTARHAVDDDLVTALHGEHGLELRIEESPVTGRRAGFEMVVAHRRILWLGAARCARETQRRRILSKERLE